MSNDQLQSIMALVKKLAMSGGSGSSLTQRMIMADEIESAIREAIAAPGVAQGCVMVPREAPMCALDAYSRVIAAGSELDGSMVWRSMINAALGLRQIRLHPCTKHSYPVFFDVAVGCTVCDPSLPATYLAAPSPTAEQPVTIKGGNE